MRKIMLLAAPLLLVACKKEEPAKTETAAAAAVTPPAPANLTAADISGTWKGMTKPETGDSVLNRWTVVSVNDSTSKFVMEGSKDSVVTKVALSADSMIATSAPHMDPAVSKKSKVVFVAVGHLKDGKLSGTSAVHLADKPDSVLMRSRWEATRAP